jgi:subtilisin family serine protease
MNVLSNRRAIFVTCLLACASSLVLSVFAQVGQSPVARQSPIATEIVAGREAVAGEVLVKLRSSANVAQIAQELEADRNDRVGGGTTLRRLHSANHQVADLLSRLSNRGDIEYAEPNFIVRATSLPNDPFFPQLWGLFNTGQTIGGVAGLAGADINVTPAWNVTTGSTGNVVAVIDTGVDYTHPDLASNMWSAPAPFSVTIAGQTITCVKGTHGFKVNTMVTPALLTCDPLDDYFHGTHVAGTVGAVGNNALGVVGVNQIASIMAVKFLDSTGSGSTADAINAIEFAIQAKATFSTPGLANIRVLSASWGGGGFSQALLDEINKANTNDMLFVAAAGNNGSNNDTTPTYPASFNAPNVVAVAATDSSDHLAGFSNYGRNSVHLGAPGVSILSTYPGSSYQYLNGTSMATPHVSGAAALVLSHCTLSTANLKTALLNNVQPIAALATATITGGRLNVNNALLGCGGSPPPTVTLMSPTEGASYVAPATIALSATASASAGIQRVEFYQGTTLITTSTSTGNPYTASWANVAAGSYTLRAKAYDTLGSWAVSAPVDVTVTTGTNVALAANGATASASSTYGSGYAASGAINGDRKGQSWGAGGGWADGTPGVWPDWLEVDFNGAQTINEIDVFSVQDNYLAPVEPTPTMTFSQYGLTNFTVQYWDGAGWVAVPGGVASGNRLVWWQVTFAALTTTKIRVYVTGTLDAWSRITEVEAYGTAGSGTPPGAFSKSAPSNGATGQTLTPTLGWGASSGATSYEYCVDTTNNNTCDTTWTSTPSASVTLSPLAGTTTYWWQVRARNAAGTTEADSTTWWSFTTTTSSTRMNVALAANGAMASASSTYGSGYAASGAINGDRKGQSWGAGGGWADGTPGVWPDWLEVDFNGAQTINEIDVFSVQDNYLAPVEPTPTMTFSQYGLTNFTVQYWDGAGWVAVPGGVASGNRLVWWQVTFAALTTTKIRVYVTGTLDAWSRITEVEAYGTAGSGTPPGAFSKSAPSNGATGQTLTPTLGWGASSGATSYEYCVDTTNNNTCDTTWTSTPSASVTLSPLAGTTTYWWQVRARNTAGTTEADSSTWWSFTTTTSSTPTNVALAANGATASASSTYGSGYAASGAINGNRAGQNWGAGGGWADGTPNVWPDWLEVDFNGAQTINEIDVFSVQDNYLAPVEPTPTLTFSQYGLTNFTVQYWDGTGWVAVPGAVASGNRLVWWQVTFAALTTTKIRVYITGTLDAWSRLTDVEAYTAP